MLKLHTRNALRRFQPDLSWPAWHGFAATCRGWMKGLRHKARHKLLLSLTDLPLSSRSAQSLQFPLQSPDQANGNQVQSIT
jgi:hypothetical protein